MSKVSVTVDLEALYNEAFETVKDNGSLESSGGMTVDDLDRAWNGMKSLFYPTNKEFCDVMNKVISTLRDAETYANDS